MSARISAPATPALAPIPITALAITAFGLFGLINALRSVAAGAKSASEERRKAARF